MWTPVWCVLLLVLVAQASPPIDIAIRRGVSDEQVPTVLVYAGHPQHQLPLRLVLGTPPPDFAPGVSVTAATHDLPGAYAALYLPSLDPLVRRELSSGTSLLPPRLNVVSRGQDVWLTVNTTAVTSTLPAYFQWDTPENSNTAWRGALVLAPGSGAWLQWQYATLRPTVLHLSNDAPSPAKPPLRLQCGSWDAQGRCIVAGAQALTHEYATGRKVDVPVTIVLDFERATGVLGNVLYGALLQNATGQSGRVLTDTDLLRVSWQGLPLLGLQDVGDGDTSTTTPLFVSAQDAAGGVVVLGRRVLHQLFTSLTYDSAENVWAATVTIPLAEADRETLAVVYGILPWLMVRFYVSALNVQFVRLIAAVRRPARYIHALDLWQAGFIMASAVFSITGASIGYVNAGAGFGVDPGLGTLLGHAALACTAVTAVEFGLLFVLLGFVACRTHGLLHTARDTTRRSGHRKSLLPDPLLPVAPLVDLWMATLYGPAAAFGLVGALVPIAGLSYVAFVVLAFVVAVAILPILFYHTLVLFGLLLTSAKLLHYPFVHLLLACSQAVLTGLTVAGAYLWVFVPFMEASSAAYDMPKVQNGSALLICIIALGVTFKFVFEAVAVFVHLPDRKTDKTL